MKYRTPPVPENGLAANVETSAHENSTSAKPQAKSITPSSETRGSPTDGEVLREIIFHLDAMEPNDDLPGY